MRYYCTLFDLNYLPNFLALYHSLAQQDNNIHIYAFCMDKESFDYLSAYPNSIEGKIKCISLDKLFNEFPVLLNIKKERSTAEFYFTCSSFITSFVIRKEILSTYVTYLDADLFFFQKPDLIFDEIGDYSVGIIPHKFFGYGKRYLKYGIYNVGWVTFKNDKQGIACLDSWRDNCEKWCFDYYDKQNDRFGDQKYLDSWEERFNSIKIIQQKGANLAPWNVGQYVITINEKNKLYVDEDPLVFYHFASFKKVGINSYTTNLSLYFSRPSKIIKEKIYNNYLEHVSNYALMIKKNINQVEIMKKNRIDVQQSFIQKITKTFKSILRWYFNDYITFRNK